jgi:ribosomal protein S18 acetylase RimI-like enzyme
MPELRLRLAQEVDAETLVAIVLEGFETFRPFAPRGWDPPKVRIDDERCRLLDIDTWCLLAESRDGEVSGHVALMPAYKHRLHDPDRGLAHLWQLFVRPPLRGTGLASCLLSAAAAEAEDRGYVAIRLFTPVDHARAVRFYEREGFNRVSEPFESENMANGLLIVEYRRSLTPRTPPV